MSVRSVDGVVRLCEEALEAVSANPRLTGTDLTVFIHLIRRLDIGKNITPFIFSQFANSMGLPQKEVCESLQRLTREGIVETTKEGGAPFYSYRLTFESTQRDKITEQ